MRVPLPAARTIAATRSELMMLGPVLPITFQRMIHSAATASDHPRRTREKLAYANHRAKSKIVTKDEAERARFRPRRHAGGQHPGPRSGAQRDVARDRCPSAAARGGARHGRR